MILSVIRYIVLTAFIIRSIRNILYYAFIWQLKEYRIDRFIAHLETPIGKKLIFSPLALIKWIPFGIYFVPVFYTLVTSKVFETGDYLITFSLLSFWIIWFFEAGLNIFEFLKFRWKFPKFTIKSSLVIFLALSLLFSPLFQNGINSPLVLAPILDKILSPILFLVVMFMNLLTEVYKRVIVYKARKKLTGLKKLKVIGITGSYGKTSTKIFLTVLLSGKFKLAVTPYSVNTIIGVANYINNNLNSEHEIFIVEMGAYKIGEIKQICDLVHPNMGIITGIGKQHIQLFGSQENIIKAKSELIECLPVDGVVIINGNSKYRHELVDFAKKHKLQTVIGNYQSLVEDLSQAKDHIVITLKAGQKKYKTKIDLLGKHNLENINLAVKTAQLMGIPLKEISKQVAFLKAPSHTMKLLKGPAGSILVDDTFNASNKGVHAALDYMRIFKEKKILVLSPLIELGAESSAIHLDIGRKAVKICDLIYLTNKNYMDDIMQGASSVKDGRRKIHLISSNFPSELTQLKLNSKSIILLEGKESAKFVKLLQNF